MEEPAPIMFGQTPLPWVNSWPHLGHEISTDDLSRPFNSSLDEDAKAKLRTFIGKFYSLRQEFGFLQPDKFFDIINIYATSFYGSNLWLFSGNNKVFSNWCKMIKLNWGLPWAAHKYVMEEISQSTHLKTKLFLRFISFVKNSRKSSKNCLSTLMNRACNDQGSVTKQNLNLIEQESGCINILNHDRFSIQNGLKVKVPEGEEWRINFLHELTELRINNYFLEDDQFTKAELATIVDYICTT